MSKSKIIAFKKPGDISEDPLTELLRTGARQLIANAVEAELYGYLRQFTSLKDEDGHQQVVRNGFLPERKIQTGIGPVAVRIPKIRDKRGQGANSIRRYCRPMSGKPGALRRYCPGFISKAFLLAIFRKHYRLFWVGMQKGCQRQPPLSVAAIKYGKEEHDAWNRQRMENRYVYIWADSVYFNIRSDDARQCILVIIGVTEHGRKEFVAIEDGHRESGQSWSDLLLRIQAQGLRHAPKLAVGDGGSGVLKSGEQGVSRNSPATLLGS